MILQVGNVYFLFIIILQVFPCTTISAGLPTVLPALGFVLFVELVKEVQKLKLLKSLPL